MLIDNAVFCPDICRRDRAPCTVRRIVDVLANDVDGLFPLNIASVLSSWYSQKTAQYNAKLTDGRRDLASEQNGIWPVPRSGFSAWTRTPKAGLFDHSDIGHDLPVWYAPRNRNVRHRVMFVFQDPLRPTRHIRDVVQLASPYGFHSSEYRGRGAMKRVERMITTLMDEIGAAVYLTDSTKLYFEGPKSFPRRLNALERIGFGRNLQSVILRREIDLFDPELIVIFGTNFQEIPIFSAIVHPKYGFDMQLPVAGTTAPIIASYHTHQPAPCRDFCRLAGCQEDGPVGRYFQRLTEKMIVTLIENRRGNQ